MSKLSPSEKRGLLVLSGIFLIAFVIQSLRPYYIKEDLYDYSVQDSIFKSISTDTLGEIRNNEFSPLERKPEKRSTAKDILIPKSININTAVQSELEKLPRIGPATAKNILQYRQENGSFKSIKEILKVKRVGPKTLELIKPYITIK